MKGREVLKKLGRKTILALKVDELGDLLVSAETLREDDTHLSGWIRILRIDGQVVIQEQTPDGTTVLVRKLATRKEAERFVVGRLNIYERMWDGCGCKIDYFK